MEYDKYMAMGVSVTGGISLMIVTRPRGKADASLAASIFHYREYSVRETKEYLKSKGVPVRL